MTTFHLDIKNKWKSQKIQKTFKNRHKNQNKNSFVSTNNTKQCVRNRCGYLGGTYSPLDRMVLKNQNMYECNKYKYCCTQSLTNENNHNNTFEIIPVWTCVECTYCNTEKLSYCFVCGTSFYSFNTNNYTQNKSVGFIKPYLFKPKNKRKKRINKKKHKNKRNEFELYWNEMNKQRKLFKENLQRYTNKNFYKIDDSKQKMLNVDTVDYGKMLKESKQLLSEYEILKKELPTINILKQKLQTYNFEQLHIKCVLQPHLIKQFCANGRYFKFETVYHGTDKRNTSSIIKRGLIIGGTKGVSIANGRAHGAGIYCSPNYGTANGYANGSLFVCLVKPNGICKRHSIWVVPNETSILPIYVLSLPMYRARYRYSGYNGCQLIKFIPQWTRINQKNDQRKTKRKWNAYYKLF